MERDLTLWFNRNDDEISVMHRKAYEKSLKCSHAVKVHSGSYYYRGFEIEKTGGTECPWNYGMPSETEHEGVKSKWVAIQCIDEIAGICAE
jgi:hypothetical protein